MNKLIRMVKWQLQVKNTNNFFLIQCVNMHLLIQRALYAQMRKSDILRK